MQPTRFLAGAVLALAFMSLAPPAAATVGLSPDDVTWSTGAGDIVHFQLRFRNPDPVASQAASGEIWSQDFGVYMPFQGLIGTFDVPPIPPDSFFDVLFDVPLGQLPPSAEVVLPGAPTSAAAGAARPETNPICGPDDHWNGNVDIVWGGPGGSGHVNKHYGTMMVSPGKGSSCIHVAQILCNLGSGATWTLKGLCPGITVALLNEDMMTPAPNPVPAGWTGWICVTADPSVLPGTVCCPQVNFDCGGQPAVVDLCVTACQWVKSLPPVPEVMDWTTQPDGTVRFQVRWTNSDLELESLPVTGELRSQEFGVFMPDVGTIGTFDIPPIPPESFFDVFYDVPLDQLPPTAEEVLQWPTAVAAGAVQVETNPGCPPDDHWDGNVDLIWDAPKEPGQVFKHYGTLQVSPGKGASYIHIGQLLCNVPGGATWSVKGLCAGFTAILVNEDGVTPAPNPIPAGWTGWICVTADATVTIGTVCCLQVNFDCGGQPAVVDLCVTVCQWGKQMPPVPEVMDWTTQPDGTVRFQVRWTNSDPELESLPVTGELRSQEFGVFMPDVGTIGTFDIPPIPPDSFFDVFFDVPIDQLPPTAQESVPGAEAATQAPAESGPFCDPDPHWDGNVDLIWDAPKEPGQVFKHYGTLQVCPGGGSSYIHIGQVLCNAPGGATWSVKGLCAGFTAILVNEDGVTPAPNPIPAGWTGWICVTANALVAPGVTCCLQVNFDCGGQPAVVDLCVFTCCYGKLAVPPAVAADFAIRSTVPNPTTGAMTITYALPRAGAARLEVFDAAGKRVRTLLDGAMEAGVATKVWEGRADGGRRLPPGTYFIRLTLDGMSTSAKILLLK